MKTKLEMHSVSLLYVNLCIGKHWTRQWTEKKISDEDGNFCHKLKKWQVELVESPGGATYGQ